ncbi:MAG: DUF2061 domain-containing protein [Bacteroidetes bacterium]|nr:DUF2061 domain-containing protein [Bacteroidota bacterium]MBU1677928.1 DUF2061 domain-containing protein [Bacteroidota bacterium]MBU2507079.1 DUF2061 domain-containing protein [Bacteroidota bacterium]
MREKRNRSILKAISWRVTGSLDTMLVSFIITGNIRIAASIGVVEVLTKTVLYYFHERAWDKIRFGRVHKINDKEFRSMGENI